MRLFGTTGSLPGLSQAEIKRNWDLSKSLVTPHHSSTLNGAKKGKADNSEANIKAGAIPKEAHIAIAQEISRSEKVFIEEGEFKGVLFRIVTGDAGLAGSARAVLANSSAFEGGVTVVLGKAADLQGQAFFDKTRKLLLANAVSGKVLQEVINGL
jgi:hypothetical protein